ncbi:MAG: hypothetical protein JO186_09415 [Actinobacteria bacterium]|nr:hypothetical protein [Actinomycetota bacterium]MBV8396913.1 hypothetical protein [Actinomycetota bacterium]MBV8599494.1 hypothetical protein [Actinomycetota bacterium]
MTTRTKLIIGGAVVVVAGLVAGLVVALSSNGGTTTLSHQEYATLFADAQVLHTKITVLNDWPRPYQTYHDGYMHRCYEWWDKPLYLYNLCFDRYTGVLVNKELA